MTPSSEFSLFPFWFWNDVLDEREILRQIADFEDHGVSAFVIHPRMGLPRDIGWMSDALLKFMSVAIEEARRRDMRVILYDEGMYPSGSSSGQVVAADPTLACRCLAVLPEGKDIPANANLVARVNRKNGQPVTIIDRPANSVIRGIHYLDEARGVEEAPPAGDILNPKTAEMVLKLVHERFLEHFRDYFGKTIIGVFTDEPDPLGRVRERNVMPGTAGILPFVNQLLGRDFTASLPALWFNDEPDAARHRADYDRAIRRRLDQTWYRPLGEWCVAHGVALCGHPQIGDEIGVERYFTFPGQDLVWRRVLPDIPGALEGADSTTGKVTSSAMIHRKARRNSSEFFGAYGHNTTFEQFKWVADWLMVRGVNLLIPHAFYYSIKGPRRDERPPQVGGVGCSWWDQFKPFADHCRRLCWVNSDSRHVCDIAIVCDPDHCPWQAAKVCFENQYDFNYVDTITLLENAKVDAAGLHIADMHYSAVIIDGLDRIDEAVQKKLAPLDAAGHLTHFANPNDLLAFLSKSPRDVVTDIPTHDLRVRHVVKDREHYYLLFNESSRPINCGFRVSTRGIAKWIDSATGDSAPADPLNLQLPGFAMALLEVTEG